MTEASLEEVSPQLRLPVAVTSYWLQHAQPTPDKRLLCALMQGMMGKRRARAGTTHLLSYRFTLFDLLRDFHVEFAVKFTTAFLSVTAPPLRTNTPDMDAAHALNQWQYCLKDAMHLNQLLNFPLQEPDVSW